MSGFQILMVVVAVNVTVVGLAAFAIFKLNKAVSECGR
jgi:hypothetical protein